MRSFTYNMNYLLFTLLFVATQSTNFWDVDEFNSTEEVSMIYDDDSCAYFSTYVTATPLNTCMAYSYQRTQYSWSYTCKGNEIMFEYFTDDTGCADTNLAGTTPISGGEGGFVQCEGAGENCHTVDINIKGFTDSEYETCDDENDFFSFSFVVDECIPSNVGSEQYSAKLSCDSEKLWFEYYTNCDDCSCDEMESYTYEYYNDFDGCWDVKCGVHDETGIGTPAEEPMHIHKGRCEDVKKNDHNGKMKLKELLSGPLDLNKGAFFQSKTQQFSANVINGALHDEVAMNWIYIIAAGAAVVMVAGAWQCVKEKQHSFI